jgi:cytidylate kinase
LSYNVITIARTLGAGGEELGTELAKALGMRYVDSEIIAQAAARAGVTVAEVARTEARKGLIDRILDSFAGSGGGPGTQATDALAQAGDYTQLIVDVIRETAAAGNVVIVAHGAAIPLAKTPGTLRILVTATPEERVTRLITEGVPPSRARSDIEDSDAERADFLQRFYGLGQEEPTHYDLVINTDRLGFAETVRAILALVG